MGVLSMCIFLIPRVFYHCHTSFTTMLIKCYATMVRFFFFFLSDTDLAVSLCLIVLSVLHAVPLCAIVLTLHNPHHSGPPSHARLHTHINALSFPAVVMIGKGSRRMVPSQIDQVVSNGKRPRTIPKPPMGFAPRAQDPVRFGRVKHMQDHLVFGLVSGVGKHW